MGRIDFNTRDYGKLRISELKRMCDFHMRARLLKMAERDTLGRVKCFITKKFFREEDIHVAHYTSRQYISLRYSFINCNLVNRWSNTDDNREYNSEKYGDLSKHHFEYKEALEEAYGESVLDRLESSLEVLYREDYDRILDSLRDIKLLYREYFEEFLFIRNKYYRRGVFKVLGEYTVMTDKILVEDKYGKSEIPTVSILSRGHKPDISTSINKEEYIDNMVKECGQSYEIVKYIDSSNVLVRHKYGICSLSINNLRLGYKAGIKSAIDKQEFFENKAKDLNDKIDWENTKILSKYINKNSKIYMQNKEGIFYMCPSSIYRGSEDLYTSYLNKSEIYLNKYGKESTLYTKIDFSLRVIEDQILICTKHGEFSQSIRNHKKCIHCCPQCNRFSSYVREDWVNNIGIGLKGEFYVIKCFNEEEEFIKVGITTNFSNRYNNKKQMPYSFEKMMSIKKEDKAYIWDLEREVLETIGFEVYTPKIFFKGSITETFPIEAFDKIKETVEKQHPKKKV